MYFEKHAWFRKQNFLFTAEPLVLRADNFLINAEMIIKPQADVIVTVKDSEVE